MNTRQSTEITDGRWRSLLRSDAGLRDLETLLADQVKVPVDRIVDFLSWTPGELQEEARIIDQVRRRFQAALERTAKDPGSLGRFLRDMDPKVFSRDHAWRDILWRLGQEGEAYEPHRRLALGKYLEYLRFRQELLYFICSRKRRPEDVRAAAQSAGYMATQIQKGRGEEELKDTSAFGMHKDQLQPMGSDRHVRLEAEVPVAVRVADGEKLELVLASHRFELQGGPDLRLVDENGVTYYLAEGRSTVGRNAENDVVVDTAFREVSRFHLVLEWHGGSVVVLTDTSTLGTFLPPGSFEQLRPGS